jgi:hypothetical protein
MINDSSMKTWSTNRKDSNFFLCSSLYYIILYKYYIYSLYFIKLIYHIKILFI